MKNVNVRFPDDLHAMIKTAAVSDRRSLNAEILALIEEAIESRQAET